MSAAPSAEVIIDPMATRFVPEATIGQWIAAHQGGMRHVVRHPQLKEPVLRSSFTHGSSFWWVVSFPEQGKIFCGPPEMFHGHLGDALS